jgi:hypothetical protein
LAGDICPPVFNIRKIIMAGLANYDGEPFRGIPYLDGNQDEKWIRFYNNSTVMTNGDIFTPSTLVDITDSTNPILKPILVAVSTMATASVLVAVVDDPSGTVAAGAWGYAKVRGCVKAKCFGTTPIVKGDQLEVLNASPTYFTMKTSATVTSSVIGTGVILGGNTSAVALESYAVGTAALKWVYLLGYRIVTE